MGEEIAFENGRISDFQGLVTLTLDRVITTVAVHNDDEALECDFNHAFT